MNSPHQREQLPDLLSDALSDAERARVESHLAQCEQCARELRTLQSMQQSLVALPAATPPDRLRANVRQALRENKKQVWTLSSFLASRARAEKSQPTDASSRPIQSRERIGAPRPFALPTRQLAWGGAVAVAAVGLMLLARPSLQNNPLSATAPVSETELASRAAADQRSPSADAAPDATKNSAISPAPQNAKPKNNQKTSPKANNSQSPAIAPPRAVQPEDLAPIPTHEMPAIELAPQAAPRPSQTPRANKKPSRPVAPTEEAPKLPVQSAPAGQQLEQSKKESENTTPATATKPAPALSRPKPAIAPLANSDASQADNGGNVNSYIDTAPSANTSGTDGARGDEQQDRSSESAPPPPSVNGTFEAAPMARQGVAQASTAWMGGEVTATIDRAQAFAGRARMAHESNAPILTLSVSKAIGDARLFLSLTNGEVQIWDGSMNALPVKIKLDNAALAGANLRPGQKIRARLEQIDGEGNPKGSTTFDLLWP